MKTKPELVVAHYETTGEGYCYLSEWKTESYELALTKECALDVMKGCNKSGKLHPVGLWIVKLKETKYAD